MKWWTEQKETLIINIGGWVGIELAKLAKQAKAGSPIRNPYQKSKSVCRNRAFLAVTGGVTPPSSSSSPKVVAPPASRW